VINDRAGNEEIAWVPAKDQGCFFDFEKTSPSVITMQNDTLFYDNQPYKTDGSALNTHTSLKRIAACQRFWHSWKNISSQHKMISTFFVAGRRNSI
jgi:hypothetical protein